MAKHCPICQKYTDARYTPFCSKRCADIDLGRWLKGNYVIPGSEDNTLSQEVPEDDGE